MSKLLVVPIAYVVAVLPFAPLARAVDFAQELPSPTVIETLNGVRIFRGWKCGHGTITRSIDGGEAKKMVSQLDRGDTVGMCGNAGANGYAELINVPQLGEGHHTIEFFDDGTKFAQAEFQVIKVRKDNFLTSDETASAATTRFRLAGFPSLEESVYVSWSQSDQGFFVDKFLPTPGDLCAGALLSEHFAQSICADVCEDVELQHDGTWSTDPVDIAAAGCPENDSICGCIRPEIPEARCTNLLDGAMVDDSCWVLSFAGQSCHDACANRNLLYDPKTDSFAGSGATDATGCVAVADALTPEATPFLPDVDLGGCAGALGCSVIPSTMQFARCTIPETSAGAASPGGRRYCACR